MAKNFAITIGINQYEYIRSLKYAATDAEKVRDFLLTEAGFNQVFYYSDHSPSINNVPTRPTRSSLLRLLKLTFEKEFMGAGDNFWFFFSGHGARVKGVDYIIPSDTFAEDIENSAISVNYIIQRLQRCGADNVVLILDACREQGDDLSKSITGMGEQTEREARDKGVISICSCSPNQYSWELEELQQGAFTYALLEGLGSKGRKATVERLNEYLKYRVKELAQKRGKQQTPRVMADPIEKSHLILMPKYATKSDVSTLKNYAYKAQINRNFEQAERLWIRVLETGVDMDAVQALQQIAIEKVGHQSSPLPKSDYSENKSSELPKAVDKSPKPLPEVELKSDVGCDYTKLKKLLSEGKWREADEETARCMLQVAQREKEGWLREEDIDKFPCTDLHTIDQLWVQYSHGKFGFSVQKEIYRMASVVKKVPSVVKNKDEQIWQMFGASIGWFNGEKWLNYSDLNFSYDTSYTQCGQLPYLAWRRRQWWRSLYWYSSLARRIVDCDCNI